MAWHGIGKSTAVVATRRQAAQLLSLLDLFVKLQPIKEIVKTECYEPQACYLPYESIV
jgi:hypothetical protein